LEGFEVEVNPGGAAGKLGRRETRPSGVVDVDGSLQLRLFSMLDNGGGHGEYRGQKQGRFREIKAVGGWRSARKHAKLDHE
jgi:hypothetical protein